MKGEKTLALFKIFKGKRINLPKTYTEGYCYFTEDDGKFYIDTTSDASGRKCLNASHADSADTATKADSANSATNATNAGHAESADSATEATSASKLKTSAGSATNPVYFKDGVPVAGTYSLNKTVPSDAVFTDTTYKVVTTDTDGLMSSGMYNKLIGIYENANKVEVTADYTSGTKIGSVKTNDGIPVNLYIPTDKNDNDKVKSEVISTNSKYAILLNKNGLTGSTDSAYINSGIYVNPSTKTITATTFDGNATTASKATNAGNADVATKLGTSAGSVTQPVYFSDGVPAACTYSLNKTVPSGAVFTDENVEQTAITTGSYPLLLAKSTIGGAGITYFNSGVTLDSATNTIKANISGNAKTATKATTAGSADSVLWNNVSGKPDSFPPSAHTHSEYANQNAFSNIKINSGTSSIAATSTTDTFNLIAGDNVTITNNGKNITIGAKDANTHYTSLNVVAGTITGTTNTTTKLTNGNVYLNHVENGSKTSSHQIKGTGATTVTTDANGNIIINSTDTDTNTTYSEGAGISISGTTISNSGVRSVASGSANGTISVNTNGIIADVKVKGLGSAAYTDSSDYQSAITGAASTITGSNLTASRALISNASGKVAVSSVTSTELGYLSGVTSAIQTQLNGTVKTTGNQTISGTKTFSSGGIQLGTNGTILTDDAELIAAYNALA